MAALRALIGLILGFGITFGTFYLVLGVGLHIGEAPTTTVVHAAVDSEKTGESPKTDGAHKPGEPPKPAGTHNAGEPPKSGGSKEPGAAKKGTSSLALIIAAVCGGISAIYSAYAFGQSAYTFGFFSILGYLLDTTWSLLNSAVGVFVWVPACMIVGGTCQDATDDSQRSGTLVFDKNPRDPSGAVYGATTIGTVIAGGWSSHEETHVWQARIFGPAYLIVYGVSLVLNLFFRLVTGQIDGISMQAYYRVCFEDWAYNAGSTSGSDIDWGGWFLWFLLSAVYGACFVLIAVGIAVKTLVVTLIGVGLLVAYSLIRTLLPVGHQ